MPQKLPPPEPRATVLTRRCIVLSFVLTIAILGLPLWHYTTSIYRAPLNYDRMDFYDKNILNELRIENDIHLNVGTEFPDLVPATQLQIDRILAEKGVNGWHIKLAQGCAGKGEYCVDLALGEENAYWVSEYSRDITITYDEGILTSNALPHMIANLLLQVFQQELDMYNNFNNPSQKLVAYSPQYHVTFSLFAQGGTPVSWDIAEALESYFRPLQNELKRVANFTVDTQVQFYSTLSVVPHKVTKTINETTQDQFVLTQDDLSTFVNFADWSLSSIHSFPTLNFILFIPSPEYTPLIIESSQSNSFLIPQWGGVAILNPEDALHPTTHLTEDQLLPVLEIFSSHLFRLLGAPTIPRSPVIRIDILSRISALRALLTSSSSLGSLHRVSQSLPDIAIPPSVLISVNAALTAIAASLEQLRTGAWTSAVQSAGQAMGAAHKAFFEKEMVQQTFFPEEHKVAVYLPLLGPVCVIILLGMVRLKKEWK